MTLREFIDWIGIASGIFPKERQPVRKQPVEEQLAEAKAITEQAARVTLRAKDRRKR